MTVFVLHPKLFLWSHCKEQHKQQFREKFVGKSQVFQLLSRRCESSTFDFFFHLYLFVFFLQKLTCDEYITRYKNTTVSKQKFLGKFKVFQLLKIDVFDFFSTVIFHLYLFVFFLENFIRDVLSTRHKNTKFSEEKFLGKFKVFQLLKIDVFDFFSTFIFSFIFLFSFLKS